MSETSEPTPGRSRTRNKSREEEEGHKRSLAASSNAAATINSFQSSPLKKLCEYTDSSNEEEEEEEYDVDEGKVIANAKSSPRKRRLIHRSKSSSGATSLGPSTLHLIYPVDIDGNLDVEAVIGNEFDLSAVIAKAFDRFEPGFRKEEEEKGDSNRCKGKEIPNRERAEFDPETFEIKTVVKRQKEEQELVVEAESGAEGEEPQEPPPQSLEIGRATRKKKSAAGRGRIDVEKKEENEEEGVAAQVAEFKAPKLRNRKFIFKPFFRKEDGSLAHNEEAAPVDVVIPEQLAASYGLYIWPCSPVLSWYVWLHQDEIRGKRVLELGAGTSLPGLLCAKIGAEKVYLSDVATEKNVLENCRHAVKLNNLEEKVGVLGITWGLFEKNIFGLCDLDYIIGSDLFFDPAVFEPLCVTLSFLLKTNPSAQVLITVQERSEDWSVEEFFLKWNLRGRIVYPREFLAGTGIQEDDLTGKHTIYILQIKSDQQNE